jgi:hypothetical protein
MYPLPRERVTEPLPRKDGGGYIYRPKDRWGGFMKYATELGSGAMIYVPSFIKIGSDI